jgi:hypothetical protein
VLYIGHNQIQRKVAGQYSCGFRKGLLVILPWITWHTNYEKCTVARMSRDSAIPILLESGVKAISMRRTPITFASITYRTNGNSPK